MKKFLIMLTIILSGTPLLAQTYRSVIVNSNNQITTPSASALSDFYEKNFERFVQATVAASGITSGGTDLNASTAPGIYDTYFKSLVASDISGANHINVNASGQITTPSASTLYIENFKSTVDTAINDKATHPLGWYLICDMSPQVALHASSTSVIRYTDIEIKVRDAEGNVRFIAQTHWYNPGYTAPNNTHNIVYHPKYCDQIRVWFVCSGSSLPREYPINKKMAAQFTCTSLGTYVTQTVGASIVSSIIVYIPYTAQTSDGEDYFGNLMTLTASPVSAMWCRQNDAYVQTWAGPGGSADLGAYGVFWNFCQLIPVYLAPPALR